MDLDHLRASDGTGEAVLAHIQTVRNPGSTVLDLDNVDNWNTKAVIITGTPAANGFVSPVGMKVMYGHLSAGDFIIDGYAPGYVDNGNTTAEVAIVKMTTSWADTLATIIGAEHKVNGKHKDITADSVLLNTGQNLSNQELFSNAIINGGCVVAQRVVPNISSTYQYGTVDRFAAKATGTAVSAGTINQNKTSLVAATKGYEIKLAGVTLTGAGIVYLRYRMEAKDALMFKNAPASFSVRIHQDTGASVNATVYINKANAADNFAAVTAVANSGAIAVPNNAATLVKFENINAGSLGDVSNGLEIEIQVAVGAITAKNISFAELTFNYGAKAAPYFPKGYDQDLTACQRYFESTFPDGVLPQNGANGTTFYDGNADKSGFSSAYTYQISLGQVGSFYPFRVKKRAAPTVIGYGNNASQWKYFQTGSGAAWTGLNAGLSNVSSAGLMPSVNASGSPDQGMISGHLTADAEL